MLHAAHLTDWIQGSMQCGGPEPMENGGSGSEPMEKFGFGYEPKLLMRIQTHGKMLFRTHGKKGAGSNPIEIYGSEPEPWIRNRTNVKMWIRTNGKNADPGPTLV